MTFDPSAQPGAFEDRKPISAEEVLQLRARVWSDGSISAEEADNLFTLNRSVGPSSEWTGFFVEAICEFLLSAGEPRGYVSDAGAAWLIAHVDRDGRIGSEAELEVIVKLLERASFAPESLRKFALRDLEQTVLGDGCVNDREAALIRRLIFAPAGDAPAKVSRAEAEMLFRLKDATLGAGNSPEWKRLFVQGVANHLMAHQNFDPPSREEEMRLEQPYKADPVGHVLSRLGRDVAGLHEVEKSVFGEDEDEKIADFQREVAEDAKVTGDESGWLKRLFENDGARDELEQALVDALAEDGVRPI
jgi:hypothetical protein